MYGVQSQTGIIARPKTSHYLIYNLEVQNEGMADPYTLVAESWQILLMVWEE